MEKIKWDGITEIEKIMPALLGLITDEEQQQAKKMAYGDFAEIIRKKYRNRGTNSGGLFVDAFRDKIMVYAEKTTYFMTWNKAAKYISQWLNEENLTISNKEENIMENQEIITQNQEIIITENYNKAVSLHRRICANAQAAQESLFEVCKGLKEMRDGKLYKELECANFEEYCEKKLGIKRHMAYKYLAVAEMKNVESIQHFGVTKLALLAKLDEPERAEIVQNTDLESTSVKELKNKISDLKKANDRLLEKASQAEKNAEDSRKKESDAWGKISVLKTDSEMQIRKISQLEKQIQELEKNPKQVAVEDTTKIKKDRQDWIDTNRENVELTQKISQLEKQIQELENRPVEVAVKDNSEEIQKLKNQLEQERQKVKVREIPDNSELFEVYYQNCMDSIDKLFTFLRNKNLKSYNGRLYELSDILNDNISMLDEY